MKKHNALLMLAVWLLQSTSSLSCPDGFYRMPVANCPTTRCYRFQEQPEIFQRNRQEKQAFCVGQAIQFYSGTGGLIQFRSIEEFNRVKLILGATQPSAPYLTSLRYSSTGTLEYVTGGSPESVDSTISSSLPLTTSNSSLFGMCVGIGLVGSSIDLMVVDCDKPQIFICDLQLTSVPVPTLAGDNIRYVGPDLSLTLSCQFAVSNAIRGVIWLRNGQDITTQFTAGYAMTANPTSVSDLVFTAFDRSNYVGSYQCKVVGQLGSLMSKTVTVLKAVAPQINQQPVDGSFTRGGLGFFSCFPATSSLPHPSVSWLRDGSPFDTSNMDKYFINSRSGRLFISDVAESDEAVYSCSLSNIEGTVNSQGGGRLTVNDFKNIGPGYLLLPNFDTGQVKALEGGELVVDCVVNTSIGSVDYRWTYPSGTPNSLISHSLNYRLRDDNPSAFGSLVLPNAQQEWSGEFRVQTQVVGVGETSINAPTDGIVTVEVQAVPAITSLNDTGVLVLGQPAVLLCENTGRPNPEVNWFRNGIILQSDADYELSGSSLTIRSVQTRDLTSFQCLAGNDVGSAVDELYLCGENGVPGLVEISVEPFTTTSVRIRWDPPTNPNDAIELLSYEVYYDQRPIGDSETLLVDSLRPADEQREWNNRQVLIDSLNLNQKVVAVVVAMSPQGRGVVPTDDQAAVGFTFGQAPASAPDSVVVTRLDSGQVRVDWNRLASSRNVDHDITFYYVHYTLCRSDVEASARGNVSVNTTTNEATIVLNVPQDESVAQVVQVEVQGVTQVRREPDAFHYGPLSSPAAEGGRQCTLFIAPPDPLPIVLGVVVPLLLIFFVVFVVVILIYAWMDRRKRGQYFPAEQEIKRTDLGKELENDDYSKSTLEDTQGVPDLDQGTPLPGTHNV